MAIKIDDNQKFNLKLKFKNLNCLNKEFI